MDACDLLVQQHREVDGLFDQVRTAEGRERFSLMEEIAEALAIHAEIEEKIFYPGVKRSDTEDFLEEAVVEHQRVKQVLAGLLDADPDTDDIGPGLHELIQDVQHHARDEETALFPKVRAEVDRQELEQLATRMAEMVERLENEEDVSERIYEEKDAPAQI